MWADEQRAPLVLDPGPNSGETLLLSPSGLSFSVWTMVFSAPWRLTLLAAQEKTCFLCEQKIEPALQRGGVSVTLEWCHPLREKRDLRQQLARTAGPKQWAAQIPTGPPGQK